MKSKPISRRHASGLFKHQKPTVLFLTLFIAFTTSYTTVGQTPLSSAFTYQGQLRQDDRPAEGAFDLEFNLYDGPDPAVDTLLATDTKIDVQVSDGLFTVKLNFGSAVFVGEALWLEIGVREGVAGSYEYVSPLQELTAAPHAQFSRKAGDADTLDGLDSSSFISNETDPTVPEHVKDGIDWSEISDIPPGTEGPEIDPTVLDSVKDGIDWHEISEIPAGFADGMDDGITDEADPTVLESVKDGVDWYELSNMPLGFADGEDDGITGETDPTVVESVKDGVHWPEIIDMPDGFADGIDHGITGETDPTVIESVKDGVEWDEISNKPTDFGEAPAGIIVMWSGPLVTIPDGWALCDGNNGTPNLSNRFILGVSNGEDPGATGGSTSHGHSTSAAGSHAHTGVTNENGSGGAVRTGDGDTENLAAERHAHGFETGPAGNHAHSVDNADHLPPYFNLAFIMKLP